MAKEIKDIEDNISYLKKVREEKEKGKRMVSSQNFNNISIKLSGISILNSNI